MNKTLQAPRKHVIRLLQHEKVRFAIVGSVGFIVNYLGLALFFDLCKLPITVAQIISVELAVLATFVGNNYWAFRNHSHIPLVGKLWRFHASAFAGMAINSIITIILVREANIYYGVALAIGAVFGLIWNYTFYSHFVFQRSSSNRRKP